MTELKSVNRLITESRREVLISAVRIEAAYQCATVHEVESAVSLRSNLLETRMWANAQPDGRPAERSWRPLFKPAKFG